MTGEQILIMILVLVVIGGVAAALIADALRRKDFRDQVEGRRLERTADDHARVSYDAPPWESSQIAIDREVLRTKSGQNLLGPK